MPTYRYKKSGVSLDSIKGQIPQADVGSLSIGSASDVLYFDVVVNATAKTDLDAFMASEGWTFDSTDPTSDVSEDAASQWERYFGTGRRTPDSPLSLGGANQVDVAAGTGVIGHNNTYTAVSWDATNINTTGFSEDTYYVYVDSSGTVLNSTTEPDTTQYIRLGGFFHTGESIGGIEQSETRADSFLSRVHDFGRELGAFVSNNAGLVQEMATDLKVVAPAVQARYGLENYNLSEIDSDDAGTNFFCWFKSADDEWDREHYWEAFGDGKVPTDRWNDTTKNASIALSANCTFTNGSTNVSTASDLTTEVDPGDFVYLDADGHEYMNRVVSINATTITLEQNYGGTGGTGASSVGKALPNLTTSKYVKHMLMRTRNDQMHLILGQAEYDTYDDAHDAGSPEVPAAIIQGALKMAYALVQQGATNLDNALIDIRPLPFHDVVGGSQGSGAVTDHGNLSGLSDDDHTQYHNNTRGDARYYTQTSFLATSTGAPDAGKPIKLDAAGHVDASMVNDGDISHALIGGVTADQHHSQVHGLGSSDHSSATLAQLNALVSDATLDDSSSSRPPSGTAGGDLTGSYPTPSIVQANVDHTQISNRGTNTHAQIDTHIGIAVTSALVVTDNAIVRGDGGARGVQETGVTIDDTDKLAIPATGALQVESLGAGVVQADASGNLSSATLTHSQLGSVSSDQHHAQLHAATHGPGQGDALKLDDLATPDDNTDLDATTTEHGLLPKLGGGTTNFLRADGTWSTPPGTPLTSNAPADVTKAAAVVGVGTNAARDDHKHDVSTAIAGAVTPGDAAAEGSATSLARSDHQHSLAAFGTASGTFCEGNDSRLSDARTPTSHASSHEPGGGDALGVDAAAATGSLRTIGTGALQACAGNDSRLSDARTPTAHATSHQSGGSDAIKLDDLATPDDNTDLDATTLRHGLLPKLGGGTVNYLRADGSWSAPLVESDPAVAEMRRTASLALTGTAQEIDFTVIEAETDDTVLDIDITDNSITVLESGVYCLCFGGTFSSTAADRSATIRPLKNGSHMGATNFLSVANSSSAYNESKVRVLIDTFAANDVITFDTYGSTDMTLQWARAGMFAFRGAQGQQGTPGADGDITWEGDWSSVTTYTANQAVYYKVGAYVCIATSTNDPPSSSPTKWELLVQGFLHLGDWNSGTTYYPGSAVSHDSQLWICKATSTNNEPPNATYWYEGARGINWLGAWSGATAYNVGDAVEDDGTSYICIAAHTNQQPPNATYWNVVAEAGTPIFGSEFQSAASEGESSTTLATYQQKLRLTTPSIPAGDYHIEWFYEHAMGGDDKQFGYRTQIDDTTTMCEGIIENKGQYSDGQWRSQSGFYIATLTAAAHNIDLDYRDVGAGDTAYIRRARLTIWRVS